MARYMDGRQRERRGNRTLGSVFGSSFWFCHYLTAWLWTSYFLHLSDGNNINSTNFRGPF